MNGRPAEAGCPGRVENRADLDPCRALAFVAAPPTFDGRATESSPDATPRDTNA